MSTSQEPEPADLAGRTTSQLISCRRQAARYLTDIGHPLDGVQILRLEQILMGWVPYHGENKISLR